MRNFVGKQPFFLDDRAFLKIIPEEQEDAKDEDEIGEGKGDEARGLECDGDWTATSHLPTAKTSE